MKQHKASAIKTQQNIEEIYTELAQTGDSKRARRKIIGASGNTGFSVTKWENMHLKPNNPLVRLLQHTIIIRLTSTISRLKDSTP
jgi:hypothetical protein